MSQSLYEAVKSGRVKLDDLNDEGKNALQSYMTQKNGLSSDQFSTKYGDPSVENNPMLTKQAKVDQGASVFGRGVSPFPQIQSSPSPSFADNAQSLNPDDANGDRKTSYPGGFLNPLNDLNRLYNAPLLRQLTHGAGQAMGLQDNQMSANKSTGSGLLDSAANIVGQGTGYLTNPAQIEQSVGNAFFGNQAIQNLGKKAGSFIESKLPQNAFGRAAANTAEQGTIGALGSAAYAPFNTLINGQDVQDIPRNMLEQGAMGGVLGGGLGALGSAAKSGLSTLGKKYEGTAMGDALNNFFNRNHPDAAPEITAQLESSPSIANSPIRLKPLNGEDSFNSILPKVYQQATERITPPLENPNELAKWVQTHLNQDGHNVSLNEVRKLDYTDLSDIATELQKGFNSYNVVRQTAHDMGYGKIFDQTAPSLKQQIAMDAQKRTFGIYPDSVNVGKSDSLNMSRNPFETIKKSTGNSFKVGDSAIPTSADGADLSGLKKIIDVQSKDGVNYYRFEGENTYMPENMVRKAENDIPLNVDAIKNEPIKLTPNEITQRERIDKFSRVDSNPIIPRTADQIQSKTAKQPTSLLQKANEAYIKGVDNLKRIDQFDQHVAEVTGKNLDASDSAYKLGLNSRGSDMIARQLLEKNLVDSQGNIIGDSLKSVAKLIPNGQQTAFEDYLVAKHSITRMGRGEKVYADKMDMTIQKAQQIVAEYEKNPKFVEAAQKYYEYNQKLGQSWLVDTGILTQQQWDGYLEANPYYVPNNRIFSDLEKAQQFGSKKGFANQTNPVKKAEGSQRKIVSPIESTIENTAKYVKTARQNEVAQAVYRHLDKNPSEFSAWGRIVEDQPKTDIAAILQKDGIEGVLNDIASGFEKRNDLTKGNIISVLINGKRVHMEIDDPQFLEAMTNLSQPSQHFLIDNIGKITKAMKVVTTGLNPVFGLTRNIFRDIPMAFIASKTSNNPLVIGKDLLGSIVSIVGDGKLYNAYKNMGGGHSSSVASDRNLLAQSKEKLLPANGLGQSLKRNLITKPFHALENLNNALETAPRLGEFKRLQDGSYDSKVNGLYEANDITVNFNKYGNYTKQADALFPYLNAAVQGLDKFVRIYKDNPKAAIAKSIAALTMPTIALYLLNHNNPEYQKLSNYTKDNYLVIPKGDGTFFKVAKPREAGIIFSSGVERALQAFAEKDPEAFKSFGVTFLTNFLPPGVNGLAKDGLPGIVGDTIAGPIQSLASNKDFLGRPIVSGTLDKLSPSLQYDSKTSEPAKKLGSLIGYSPKKIDFLVKSYGGIIGQLGIPATTQGSTIKDTLLKQITTDPNYSNDISADFYNAKNKADVARADAKITGKQPKKDLSPLFNKITDVLSTLRKQSNSVQNDSSLSREEKKNKLDIIQKQSNDIQSNFLKITK